MCIYIYTHTQGLINIFRVLYIFILRCPLGLHYIFSFLNFLKIHRNQINKFKNGSKYHYESIQIQHPHCKQNDKYLFWSKPLLQYQTGQRYICDTFSSFSQLYHNKIIYLIFFFFFLLCCILQIPWLNNFHTGVSFPTTHVAYFPR